MSTETAGDLLAITESELEAAGRRRSAEEARMASAAGRIADCDTLIATLTVVWRYLSDAAPEESLADLFARCEADLAAAEADLVRCEQEHQAAMERKRDVLGYQRIAAEVQKEPQ